MLLRQGLNALPGQNMGNGVTQGRKAVQVAIIKRVLPVAAQHRLDRLAKVVYREQARVANPLSKADQGCPVAVFRGAIGRGMRRFFQHVGNILLPERPGSILLFLWEAGQGKGCLDVSAAAHPGVRQPVGFQILVGSFHGDAVDAQVAGELPGGGQARLGRQAAGNNPLAQVVFNLLVERNFTLEIEWNTHGASLVYWYYHYTPDCYHPIGPIMHKLHQSNRLDRSKSEPNWIYW